MEQFLILLEEEPMDPSGMPPEQIEQVVGEYTEWMGALIASGALVSTQKTYTEPGRQIRGVDGKAVVSEGPFAGSAQHVGGFFVVHAQDYAAAVDLCSSSPHVKYGERLVIKRCEPLPDMGAATS